MKKIFLVGIVLITSFFMTGCTDKTALTAEQFKNTLENKGYAIEDATEQMAQYDYITKVYIAIDKSKRYQIEFYTFTSDKYAEGFYNTNKSIFEKSKSSGVIELTVSIGNNSKYTLATGGKYKVISQIDNTAIYIDADNDYKKPLQDLLKSIDY